MKHSFFFDYLLSSAGVFDLLAGSGRVGIATPMTALLPHRGLARMYHRLPGWLLMIGRLSLGVEDGGWLLGQAHLSGLQNFNFSFHDSSEARDVGGFQEANC